MHELSIATAIIGVARSALPRGALLRSVSVRAGAMRAIEPESLRWAWVCATEGTELAGTRLDLEVLPWKLACPACGREFDAETTEAACPSCARPHVRVVGSDELQVVSLTVDDLVAGAV